MILFKQYPLNGLNTFEDEMLFLAADVIVSIKGKNDQSSFNKFGLMYSDIMFVKNITLREIKESVNLNQLCSLCKKYNKSFSGLFEIKFTQAKNGRWSINIVE